MEDSDLFDYRQTRIRPLNSSYQEFPVLKSTHILTQDWQDVEREAAVKGAVWKELLPACLQIETVHAEASGRVGFAGL